MHKLSNFKDMAIRHTVDFMYIKKNIYYGLIVTLVGAFDTISSRQYFQQLNIRRNFWVEKYRKPSAPDVWTKEQCAQFLKLMF